MNYVIKLETVTKDDLNEVGGKAASLGEMMSNQFPVPSGFVITTKAFKDFSSGEISQEFKDEVIKEFNALNAGQVAVRSSAVAEDSKSASWAGQLETYLNTTKGTLLENIQKCWNSVKTERAKLYAKQKGIEEMIVAVVIQKMVDAKMAGVMFTKNPVNGNEEIMIEAVAGLGEALVQGEVTPDNFIVDKKSFTVIEQTLEGDEPLLDADTLKELGQLSINIENHYQAPQDIEWAIDKDKKIWILQSRPITTLI
jgi:phosphoenolpyruvate synthase/pyruvate phosphate dikinase